MDNAFCGGSGATLTGTALASVKAAIFMGDPHNVNGLSYNVGTCRAGGVSQAFFPMSTLGADQDTQFAARPSGYKCAPGNAALIQSYCDSTDPYCCNGNDANSHQQYVNKYGQQALAFIKKQLDAA